jgi:hypothetical protein
VEVATQLDIAPHPARRFGWAVLTLRGVAPPADARFRLRRLDGEPAELGPHGWQNGPADLTADAVRAEGGDLVLEVGPAVVDHIVMDTRVEVELPAAGATASAFWPDIPPSASRRGGYTLGTGPGLQEAPAPFVAKPPPLPPPEPVAPPPPPPITRPGRPVEPVVAEPPRRRPWLLALGGLVLLAAGAFWWLETQCLGPGLLAVPRCSAPVEPPPERESPPADLRARYDQLLQRIPPATGAELWAVAQEAERAGQRDLQFDAANEAVAEGHGPALLQFGRWRDPRYVSGGGWPFDRADPAIAVDYYRRVQDAGVPEGGVELTGLCQHLRAQDGALAGRLCPP